jgi:capsular polysaccharide biosynthesis protein
LQLKEQAKGNAGVRTDLFHNCEKGLTTINTTQILADELKTSHNTASRIIQIQAKADEATKAEKRMKAGLENDCQTRQLKVSRNVSK